MASELQRSVMDGYWYLLYVDGLPIMQFLGYTTLVSDRLSLLFSSSSAGVVSSGLSRDCPNGEVCLYTHKHFVIKTNGDKRIIRVDLVPSKLVPIRQNSEIVLSYDVEWIVDSSAAIDSFERRYDRYLETDFFENKVHIYSILNTFAFSLFLCAIVVFILLRALKQDINSKYANYRITNSSNNDIEMSAGDTSASATTSSMDLSLAQHTGWKQVYGDVFRRPNQLLFFTVLLSSGIHIAASISVFLWIAILNSLYTERGSTGAVAFLSYTVTAPVSGFLGGLMYKLYGGKNWKKAMFMQCGFLPGLISTVFCIINTLAWYYGSTYSASFGNVATAVSLYVLVNIPLLASIDYNIYACKSARY